MATDPKPGDRPSDVQNGGGWIDMRGEVRRPDNSVVKGRNDKPLVVKYGEVSEQK